MNPKLSKIFSSIAGFLSFYLFYRAGKIYLVRRKYRHIPGPPTKGIIGFFFGHILDMQNVIRNGQVFPEFLLECNQKYGNVFKFQFFGEIFILTTDREAIKDILITKNYPKSPNFMKFLAFPLNYRLLGYGLVTDLDQQRWKHRRTLFNPGFHRNVLVTFVNQFNTKADMLMERLRTLADGKTITSLFKEINHATLDAIAQIAFGMNIDSINQKDPELSLAISTVLKTFDNALRDPFYRFRMENRKKLNQVQGYIDLIRNTGKEKILERFKALKNQDYIPTDILSSILQNWGDQDMDLDSMIDDFVTFFIAGQETTANALAFCFLEIGKNKNIFVKAREEIDRVLGERSEISYQDAIDLKYCSSIFKEALRMYPPAPVISRFILDEMNINGIRIPANSSINLSPFVCGRTEKYFPNPLEFKPERFMKDQDTLESSIENYTYFPFSLGPRNCIGQNFAQIEGVIIIAKLLQNFDYHLDQNQSLALAQDFTLRPKDGTRCILTLRN